MNLRGLDRQEHAGFTLVFLRAHLRAEQAIAIRLYGERRVGATPLAPGLLHTLAKRIVAPTCFAPCFALGLNLRDALVPDAHEPVAKTVKRNYTDLKQCVQIEFLEGVQCRSRVHVLDG